ncbi:hypothetical protein BSKO_11710 [Bryopsis sp. KO-2023]|nr:hypothetical protein BSKO_11710 [Bryopsis sp. KO-2023]
MSNSACVKAMNVGVTRLTTSFSSTLGSNFAASFDTTAASSDSTPIFFEHSSSYSLSRNLACSRYTLSQVFKWGRNSHFLDALPESRELRVHFRRQLAAIIQDRKEYHRCSMEVIKMAGQAGIDVNTMLRLGDTPNSLLAYSKALKKVGKELDTYFLKYEMKRIDQGVLTVDRRYQAKLLLELARRAEEFGERPQETIALLEKARASDENWVKPSSPVSPLCVAKQFLLFRTQTKMPK